MMERLKIKIGQLRNSSPTKLEWIIICIVLGALYLSFASGDLLVTGNRSFLYYEGFFEFYTNSYEMTGGYGANYLPSTFLLFAIWNLPLYLLGRIPFDILESSLINVMWYKLLPIIAYFLSAHLLEKIALEVGFGEKKAKVCKYAFIICPIGVYGQFIFGQYDSFTVLCMLLGIWYYLKDDWKKFVLFFGLAITFKYHAIIYFMVLLLLKEKKVLSVLSQLALCCAVPLVEVFLYVKDANFVKSVFGFTALDKVSNGLQIGSFGSTNLMLIVSLLLFMWAYVTETTSKEELFKWAIFLCSGVSFVFFGLCTWHPQWLVMMVPFLVLSVLMNKYGKIFLLLENVFIIAFYVLISTLFVCIADQALFLQGIFKYALQDTGFTMNMSELYGFNDVSMLSSCVMGILLIFFLFNHPKYHFPDLKVIGQDLVGNIRLLFLVGILTFVIPASMCLFKVIDGERVVYCITGNDTVQSIPLIEGNVVQQYFIADVENVVKVEIPFGTYDRINHASFMVRIREEDSNDIIYEKEISMAEVVDNNDMYTIINEDIPLKKGNGYCLEIEGDGDVDNCLALYLTNYEEENKGEYLLVNGIPIDAILCFGLYGK